MKICFACIFYAVFIIIDVLIGVLNVRFRQEPQSETNYDSKQKTIPNWDPGQKSFCPKKPFARKPWPLSPSGVTRDDKKKAESESR